MPLEKYLTVLCYPTKNESLIYIKDMSLLFSPRTSLSFSALLLLWNYFFNFLSSFSAWQIFVLMWQKINEYWFNDYDQCNTKWLENSQLIANLSAYCFDNRLSEYMKSYLKKKKQMCIVSNDLFNGQK